MNRREFLSAGFGGSAWLALAGLPGSSLFESNPPPGSPLVIEVVGTTATWKDRNPTGIDCARLIGRMLGELLESGDFPLDILSGIFPESDTAAIKIDAESPGRITAPLALSLAGLLLDAEVPPDRIAIWDREPGPLHAVLHTGNRQGSPRVLAVGESGGYGRRIEAGGDTPPFRMSLLVDATRRHATITALSTGEDGTMSPFVIESLALGAVDWTGTTSPGGVTAARVAADPALLPRSVLHIADLWEIPLGLSSTGEMDSWTARTVLFSRDAVALTRVAHTILANTRSVRGLGGTPEPESLAEAARLRLGEGDPSRIRWRKLTF